MSSKAISSSMSIKTSVSAQDILERAQSDIDAILKRAGSFFDDAEIDGHSDNNEETVLNVDAVIRTAVTPAMQIALAAQHRDLARLGQHRRAQQGTSVVRPTPTSIIEDGALRSAGKEKEKRGRFVMMVLYHLYQKLAF